MSTFSKKLRFLLWPATIALLAMITLVLSLRWLLNLHFPILTNEDLWVFVYPILLGLIVWVVFLWRRIDKAIKPKWKSGDVLHLLAIIFLILPVIWVQLLMRDVFTSTKTISTVKQVDVDETYVRWKFQELPVNMSEVTGNEYTEVSGGRSPSRYYRCYFMVPITDLSGSKRVCWLTRHYEKSISNRSSESEKDFVWNNFFEQSYKKFDREVLGYTGTVYLQRLTEGNDWNYCLQVLEDRELIKNRQHVFFELKDKNESSVSGPHFWGMIIVSGLFLIYFIVCSALVSVEPTRGSANREDIEAAIAFLKFKTGVPVTATLVYTLIAFWYWQITANTNVITSHSDDVLTWCWFNPASKNEWHTIFTAPFVTIGLMQHILVFFIVVALGHMVEKHLKPLAMLVLCLTLIVVGGFANILLAEDISYGIGGLACGLAAWYFVRAAFNKYSDGWDFWWVALAVPLVEIVAALILEGDFERNVASTIAGVLLALVLKENEAGAVSKAG